MYKEFLRSQWELRLARLPGIAIVDDGASYVVIKITLTEKNERRLAEVATCPIRSFSEDGWAKTGKLLFMYYVILFNQLNICLPGVAFSEDDKGKKHG